MSWPTNIFSASGGIGKSLGLLLVALFFLEGCAGYNLAGKHSSVLGDGTKTLKFREVEYPTLQPWLPYIIRSTFRDEINARHMARWVDSGPADYEILIKVISYTNREWVQSYGGYTVLFDTVLSLESFVYDGTTGKEVWRSGRISYDDRVEQANEQLAASDITTQIIRQLVDRLRNSF